MEINEPVWTGFIFNKIPENSMGWIFLYLQNFCTSNFCAPLIFLHLKFLRVHIFACVSIFLRACPYFCVRVHIFACMPIFCVRVHIFKCVSLFLRVRDFFVRVHFFCAHTIFRNYDQNESFGSVICLRFIYHSLDTLEKIHLETGSESLYS